ncbi:Flavonol sulfotransferase-like protein [Triticum urartu]|uniref:Sulfotransferase n=1 Tax=Triticum urartu TaxID=4572 RepID=M7YDC2_TRIUA|nr:Flavonol sulfotransferase-like protein [Triticum urartu]
MASSPQSSSSAPKADDEAASHKEIYDRLLEVVSTYPTAPSGIGRPYTHHPDGWYAFTPAVVNSMVIKRHLKARDTDVFLATFPKSGTTWLKALLFATLRRTADGPALAPLAAHSPHQLIPFLEFQVFANGRIPDLSSLPAPRVLMTHIPSRSLPESVAASGCKVVYLCRDPKDCFVSLWHFWNGFAASPWDLGEALLQFCDGVSLFGPFWEHVLGYWRWHVERPEQVRAGALPDLRGARRRHGRSAEAPRCVCRLPVHGRGAGGQGRQGDRGGMRHGEPGGTRGEPVREDRHDRDVSGEQHILPARCRWRLEEPPDAGDGEKDG